MMCAVRSRCRCGVRTVLLLVASEQLFNEGLVLVRLVQGASSATELILLAGQCSCELRQLWRIIISTSTHEMR